ncbi:diguanylate cyclase with PAS/PAC sensor [Arcobacter nitrofigilis DSM 7299]|uniref:Diguanylate cyclase with PAS/PAC sensor n=1 Tax=Arcobacter nitrofigilis (strain ATCC 33309 / DSM 7299 / CCUG 15893 / LMG 7604 / NCTC 12251 / CI) TaxID=572480 RepID=D5V2U7_ARCNC|nr:diguanylate cyclase [Arcobacter nitrofigilis]ADG92529.1 diguanylate cyclase with PAS/PAC sensor [Arcobacter nitrofigilis DSM 7299]
MKKNISYAFLKSLLFFTFIFLLVSITYIKNLENIYTKEINNSIESELNLKITTAKNNFKILKKDLLYISEVYEINKNYSTIKKELSTLLAMKKSYMEIYFLKNDGTFLLKLKNKTDMEPTYSKYLPIISQLKKGDIYLSPIELKKENQKIENPKIAFVSMITPLFDKDKPDGFLVINYPLTELFNIFSSSNFNLETLLINKDDYILNSKNDKFNFGFEFNKNSTFDNIYKNLSTAISKNLSENSTGTFKNDDFHVNINKINLSSWLNNNSQIEPLILKLVTIIDNKLIDIRVNTYLKSIMWLAFLYFLIAMIISIIFANYNIREKETRLRLKISDNVFENSHDGILITDRNNKVQRVNKSFTKITGYTEKEILNKSPKILKSTGFHTKLFYKNIWDNLNEHLHWEGEITNIRKNGVPYTEELSISKIYTDENDFFYIASFVDITESKKNKKMIEDKLEENKTYLEIINDYLITIKVDINGKILDVSDAFCLICGYSKEELIGHNHDILRHPETPREFYLSMWENIYSGKNWEGEIKNIKKNGESYYVHTNISPMYNNNTITGYALVAVDITDKKRIEEMSITDELTQTYNRRYFNITIEKEIARAKRDNKTVAFAILDIDFFKQYNDTYGHNKGDKALQDVALCLKETIHRASDYTFRLGGEEFGILTTDINQTNFHNLLEKIRINVEDLNIEHTNSKISSKITVSIGGVVINNKNINSKKIYKLADKILYKVKDEGRNKVFVEEEL